MDTALDIVMCMRDTMAVRGARPLPLASAACHGLRGVVCGSCRTHGVCGMERRMHGQGPRPSQAAFHVVWCRCMSYVVCVAYIARRPSRVALRATPALPARSAAPQPSPAQPLPTTVTGQTLLPLRLRLPLWAMGLQASATVLQRVLVLTLQNVVACSNRLHNVATCCITLATVLQRAVCCRQV